MLIYIYLYPLWAWAVDIFNVSPTGDPSPSPFFQYKSISHSICYHPNFNPTSCRNFERRNYFKMETKSLVGLTKAKPYLAMTSLQFGFAGMYIITMVSLQHGMNHYVLAAYRHLVATIVIAPFALVLERSSIFSFINL